MKTGISERDRELVRAVSRGLPISESPYREVAAAVGLSEEETIATLRGWLDSGVIRRLAGIVHHRRSGYQSNAMVVWEVPADRVEPVGESFAARPEITHCYQRPTADGWPYGLYTMVHARNRGELKSIVEDMARAAGIASYRILNTVREYKKEPVRYFESWGNDR